VTIEVTGTGDGRVAWGFDPFPAHPLDGLAFTASIVRPAPILEPASSAGSSGPDSTPAGRGQPAHPNGITGIDHVVVATGDAERTSSAFRAAGLEFRRERATTMAGEAMLQRFFWAGDVIIELVAAAEANGGPASIWGIACTSPDIDATVAWWGPDRCAPARVAVQAGRRIASLRTRALGISTRIAVMSPHTKS